MPPRRPITRLPRHLPQATTSLTEPPDIVLTADDQRAPARRPGWHIWAWATAISLHALVLALAIFVHEKPLPEEQDQTPGISMVFDKGGAAVTSAPKTPIHGPPQPAMSAAQPPPPPPQPQAEVNLNLPQNALSDIPLPPPPPHAVPHTATHHAPPAPPYIVMNGMSYGHSPALPSPPAPPGMNMSMPESDAQAALGEQLTVKSGDVGADWMSELNDWVNRHKYYPQQAAEQNQQGSVEIEITVNRQGQVTRMVPVSGSGSNFLDLAWQGMFLPGTALPPFPPGTKGDSVTIDATMQYELVNP